jgi:glycerol-3-phosphate dehydrogenase
LILQFGLETEVAKHLAMNYGDRAWTVCSYLQQSGEQWPHHGIKVSPQYPFIEAEIHYAVHHEYAQTAIDFLSRRSRLSFLNAQAALDALPRVIEVMGQELKWDSKRRRHEYEHATQQLRSMGLVRSPHERRLSWSEWLRSGFGLLPYSRAAVSPGTQTRAIFSPGELENARSSFSHYVREDTNKIPSQSVPRAIQEVKGFENVKGKQIKYAISQVGIKETEDIGVDDFIEVSCFGANAVLKPC